jgi:hypothetical protein
MQDGGNSLYYEISSMEGSGDTCAIICISGSGPFNGWLEVHTDAEIFLARELDLKSYSRLAGLAKNAALIRLFHLPSVEASEGEPYCSESREFSYKSTSALNNSQPLYKGSNPPAVTTVPVRFIITRDLRQWDYALCIFSAGIRLQPTA